MKRFHVHIAVDHLDRSIAFYSNLFGQAPTKQQTDYAKWMLDDPRINFAISTRGHATGLNHFGIQADTTEELAQLKILADTASGAQTLDQEAATCCYANSKKHWVVDPQGLPWEHFLTMSDAQVYGDDTATQIDACCIPLHKSAGAKAVQTAACCVPKAANADKESCCN